ncbi:MAG: hypothetical protein ACC652_04935 [Acidimicrobiales bacterium]
MIKRIWSKIKAMFGTRTHPEVDPEAEIQRTIDHARVQDQQLRNQAARVIASRARLEGQIYERADQVADSEDLSSIRSQLELAIDAAEEAKQAVLKNALCLEESTFDCFETASKVGQARMREKLNRAVRSMSAPIELNTPSMSEIDRKISQRTAVHLQNDLKL